MSDTTKIQWAEHTGGPFLGCSPVSPGCANCYAWELALTRLEPIFRKAYKAAGFKDLKTLPVWGEKATRVLSKGFWNDARRINAQHAKAGTRGRWFPSMIDWLDTMPAGIIDQEGNELDSAAVLADFLKLIYDTPKIDWLLLTKRPENFRERITAAFEATNETAAWLAAWVRRDKFPANIWIGVSVEDQKRADERIPELLKIPAVVRFLSCEPLLGPVDLSLWLGDLGGNRSGAIMGVDWVIVGGESGTNARPCNVAWIRSIVEQCKAAGVAPFVKQLGAKPVELKQLPRTHSNFAYSNPPTPVVLNLTDKKGGDMAEWPEDLRVREFPCLEQKGTK